MTSTPTPTATATPTQTSTPTPTPTAAVILPPGIAKAFSPAAIPLDGTSTLTFTLTNPNPATDLVGVAFADTLPAGLTVASSTVAVCGGTTTTTAPDAIALTGATIAAAGQCQLSVTVIGAAAGFYTNTTGAVTSSNGGTGGTATATLTVQTPDLAIAKTHVGDFRQGQIGAQYSITVTNVGSGPTDGTAVTVADVVPTGLTATAIVGTGWACTRPAGACVRSDVLAAGASYPAITLTVNVAPDAPPSLVNLVTVSGGGDPNPSNNTGTDPATVVAEAAIPLFTPFVLGLFLVAIAALGVLALARRA